MQNDDLLRCVEKARGGDEQALAALIARYMPVIRIQAAGSACPGLDFDDAVQEGLIGFFRAIETYDSTHVAAFSTYAAACIRNAVCDAQRTATRQKHAMLNTSLPLDEAEDTVAANTPEELLLASEQYADAMQDIAARLSVLERRVLSAFLDGQAYSAIAAQLGITEKAVGNALQRVRTKLR